MTTTAAAWTKSMIEGVALPLIEPGQRPADTIEIAIDEARAALFRCGAHRCGVSMINDWGETSVDFTLAVRIDAFHAVDVACVVEIADDFARLCVKRTRNRRRGS